MNKALTYSKNWLEILVSPRAYLQFLKYNNWQLLLFLVSSSILLSFIWSAKVIRFDVAQVRTNTQLAAQEFIEYYPAELTATWDQTSLQLEPSQEYTLYYPSFISDPTVKASLSELSFPDTLARYTPEEISNETLVAQHTDTFFVVTPTKVYVQGTENEWQSSPLSDLLSQQDFTITKDSITASVADGFINSPNFWNQVKVGIILIAPVLVFKGLLWNSLIQWLLSYLIVIKLYGVSLSGKKLAKLVIPIVVVTTLIQLLAQLLYGQVTVPLFSIGYWVLLFLVLRDASKRKAIQQAK